MPPDRFINQRKNAWQRLEDLLKLLDTSSLRRLNRDEVRELGRIYRRTASDLAIARAESRDPRLVNYLNSLVIRAHGRIYRADAQGGKRIRRFFTHELPQTFRRTWRYTLLSFSVFAVFAVFSFVATRYDPEFSELVGVQPAFRETYIETKTHWWERLNEANQEGVRHRETRAIVADATASGRCAQRRPFARRTHGGERRCRRAAPTARSRDRPSAAHDPHRKWQRPQHRVRSERHEGRRRGTLAHEGLGPVGSLDPAARVRGRRRHDRPGPRSGDASAGDVPRAGQRACVGSGGRAADRSLGGARSSRDRRRGRRRCARGLQRRRRWPSVSVAPGTIGAERVDGCGRTRGTDRDQRESALDRISRTTGHGRRVGRA